MDRSIHRVVYAVLVGVLLLALAACAQSGSGQSAATATPSHAEPQEAAHTEETSAAEEGKALFSARGCAACHGPEAEGSENGPALPGHTAEQIERQVRNPLGQMPPFTEQQISEEDLEKIVAYITSLAPAEAGHGHEFEASTPAQAHLLMALFSLEADNLTDSEHHLRHAIEIVHGEQAEAVHELVDSLEGGDMHAVRHELEEMLAEAHEMEQKTAGALHLELALSALEVRDVENARHHLDHFVQAASSVDKLKGEQILKLMDEEDFHEARHGIESMLGMTPHGG